jgi:hypothetical protein
MSSRFYSLYKGAVLAFVLFFASWNAEASCFSRQELYRMQTSSLEDIQAFLKAEGWEVTEPGSVAEGTTGFGFRKSVFTKNGNERVVVYTSKSEGNLIHLKVGDACFQTISGTEFGQFSRKLSIEQDKVIKEYRNENQILQLMEYAGTEVSNSEILIFNGSRLCEVADLDALHCQPTKMLIRCTKLQFCAEPAITQNRCCAFVVLFCPLYSRSILLLLGSHTLCQVLVCVSARATWQCVWLVGWF